MTEIQNIEKKLASAEQAVAEMRQELDKTSGDLDRLDVNAGDLDKTVDVQIRLEAKKAILEKRVALAAGAVLVLQGDVLLAKEQELSGQLAAVSAQLEAAKATARDEILKLVEGGALDQQANYAVSTMVLIHREVRPLLARHEFIAARQREAAYACADVIRRRSMAESAERGKLQEQIFNENA